MTATCIERKERRSFRVKGRKEATHHTDSKCLWETVRVKALEKRKLCGHGWQTQSCTWQDGRRLGFYTQYILVAAVSVCNPTRELFFFEIIFPGVGVKCHLSKCRFDARCHTCIRSIQWLFGRSVERLEQFQRCTPPTMKKKGERTRGEHNQKGKKKCSAMKNRWQ